MHMFTSVYPASPRCRRDPSESPRQQFERRPAARRRGEEKKKKTAAQPSAAIYHNGARVRISARPHALPAFATGASRRQKVTGGKRDCRQAAKQDAQNAAGEGKMNLGVTVKNCFSKVPQNDFCGNNAS